MKPGMTTSEYRIAADEAEKRGQWGRAIDLWQSAIDSYPHAACGSAIAKRDITRMESRQEAARRMYFPA